MYLIINYEHCNTQGGGNIKAEKRHQAKIDYILLVTGIFYNNHYYFGDTRRGGTSHINNGRFS